MLKDVNEKDNNGFEEGKVYRDRYNRIFYYEKGSLHTTLGFRYKVVSKEDLEEFKLTKMTKLQMIEMLVYRKRHKKY